MSLPRDLVHREVPVPFFNTLLTGSDWGRRFCSWIACAASFWQMWAVEC